MPKTTKKKPGSANGASSSVRIIGGQWRGRALHFPGINGLRPTGNRIRETLFNWLMPVVPGSRCLDAFTGSGALGFEALSRQAKEVVMLEPDQLAYRHLIDNAQNLNATGCKIFGTRAEQWLAIPATEPFDIVFIDPPFALELWSIVLEVLEANNWLAENAWIYVETPKTYSLMAPQNWRLHRTKQAGNVTFSLYQRDFSSDS